MKHKSARIAVDGGSTWANNPFAGLAAEGLPQASPPTQKQPSKPTRTPSSKQRPRIEIRREKAGRGGKTVTTLRTFPSHIALAELDALALKLKKTCACGGTHRDRVIELQGDVRNRVSEELVKFGYQPVLAGG